jgi:hypothetical protein
MKRAIGLFMIISVLALSYSCKKDNIDDDPTPTEQLPPDDGAISGTITGTINETQYDDNESTTSVSITRLCHTIEKFVELQNQIAVKPQGAVVMIIVAMYVYQKYPIEGMKCLSAASTSPLTAASTVDGNYQGQIMLGTGTLKNNLLNYPRLPYIYYQGASPQNGYVPTAPPYVVNMYTNTYSYSQASDGLRIKLFVETLGADSNRPCTVKKVGNIYKVTEFSSLYLSHKPIIQ